MPLAPLPLAISIGDPAGVGPEIIGKAWDLRKKAKLHPFFAIGDADCFAKHWVGPVERIEDPAQALYMSTAAARFFQAAPILMAPTAPCRRWNWVRVSPDRAMLPDW
jgi:4-hydroxy-L-threonine phosphate dehydrogenase PdxA